MTSVHMPLRLPGAERSRLQAQRKRLSLAPSLMSDRAVSINHLASQRP